MIMAGYGRVSTDREEQLDSSRNQKDFFEQLAQAHNHTLFKVYADDGKRGGSVKRRKEFQNMMRDARAHLFELLVIKDFSRFARNTVDFLVYFRELKELGTKVVFASFGMKDLTEATSEMIITMHAAMAQEESSNLSFRVKFGKEQTAKHGRVPVYAFGYDHIDHYTLKINEREAEIVRRIFSMYVNEGKGVRIIGQILSAEGVKTKLGNGWSENAVLALLRNDLYAGILYPQKGVVTDYLKQTWQAIPKDERKYVFDRPECRIVDRSVFDQAQAILAKRGEDKKQNGSRYSNKHAFSSVIHCESCGSSFRHLAPRTNGAYAKWGCRGRDRQGVKYCDNSIKLDQPELFAALSAYFSAMTRSKTFVTDFVREFTSLYRQNEKKPNDVASMRKELAKLKREKTKYMEMFQNDVISMIELKEKTGPLNKDIQSLEDKVYLAEKKMSSGDSLDQALQKAIHIIGETLDVSTWSGADLKRLVENITVSKDGHATVYLRLLDDLNLDRRYLIRTDVADSVDTRGDTPSGTGTFEAPAGASNVLSVTGGQCYTRDAHIAEPLRGGVGGEGAKRREQQSKLIHLCFYIYRRNMQSQFPGIPRQIACCMHFQSLI